MPVAHLVVIPRPWNHRWPTGDDVSSSPRYIASWVPPGKMDERWRGWIKLLAIVGWSMYTRSMDVSEDRGFPPKSSISMGLSIIFTIHFIFGNTHMDKKTSRPVISTKKKSHKPDCFFKPKKKCKILFCWTVFNLCKSMTLTFCSPLIFHRFTKSKLSRSPNYHPSFTLQAQVLPKCGRRERALDSQRNPCTNCQQLLDPPGLRMEALHLQAVSSLKKSDQKRVNGIWSFPAFQILISFLGPQIYHVRGFASKKQCFSPAFLNCVLRPSHFFQADPLWCSLFSSVSVLQTCAAGRARYLFSASLGNLPISREPQKCWGRMWNWLIVVDPIMSRENWNTVPHTSMVLTKFRLI